MISPVLLVIATLIKLQDGGPILFKQKRVGRGGEEFWMYKFRSMVIDAEARKAALMIKNEGKGGLFKLTDDPRITPLGKFLRDFSLDELPQLFNVLNGTMSLVGPRPHLAHELAQMPSEASRRALVTPGLTGLWQVSGRSDLEGDDAVRLDLRYVENWTFTLDMLILWKTASAVWRSAARGKGNPMFDRHATGRPSAATARRALALLVLTALVGALLVALPPQQAQAACTGNASPARTSCPGTRRASGTSMESATTTIQGFATQISVNAGSADPVQDRHERAAPTRSRSTGSVTTRATVRV